MALETSEKLLRQMVDEVYRLTSMEPDDSVKNTIQRE